MIKDIINVMRNDHTIGQKVNYLKYKFAKKCEVLKYDPVAVSIVATGRCTLACDMCPTHSNLVPRDYPHLQKNVKDMSFAMFKEIIHRFKNALEIHIIGSGEPLLNRDFFKMVDYAASRKMIVKSFSNGTTIRDNVDGILNSKLNGITISLNGHNAEEFRRMTGMNEETYSEIYGAVKMLIEEKKKRGAGVKVKLSFIIDKYNYKFIPEMVALSQELSVDNIFFSNFLPAPYEGLSADERVLIATEEIKDELKAIFRNYSSWMRRSITAPILVDKRMYSNRCDTHFRQIRFDGDGNISSCSMMLLDMAGHGTYKDENIWNSAFFRRMRILFLSDNDENLPEPCRACPDNRGVAAIG